MDILLAPGTTDGVTTDTFTIGRRAGNTVDITVALYPEANLGADTAILNLVAPDGTLIQATDDNGVIALSATRLTEVVVGQGTYAFTIATRTGSWGIGMSSNKE